MIPPELIGKEVFISWKDPDADWQHFRVLKNSASWLLLQGLADGDAEYTGTPFWVRESEIDMFEETR